MEFLKNLAFGLSPQLVVLLIPGALTSLGMSFKNKDDNTVGTDDAAGNILIALAPVIPAFVNGDQVTVRKVLLAVYDVIGGYLGIPPRESALTKS